MLFPFRDGDAWWLLGSSPAAAAVELHLGGVVHPAALGWVRAAQQHCPCPQERADPPALGRAAAASPPT